MKFGEVNFDRVNFGRTIYLYYYDENSFSYATTIHSYGMKFWAAGREFHFTSTKRHTAKIPYLELLSYSMQI